MNTDWNWGDSLVPYSETYLRVYPPALKQQNFIDFQ